MMSVSFLFAAFMLTGRRRLERVIRWILLANFVLAIVSLAVLAIIFGHDLEYLYECTIILINWPTLIVAGILLSRIFRDGTRPLASGSES